MKITTVGIDLAKNLFQVHGIGERGKAVLRKQLRRSQVAVFFGNLPPDHAVMPIQVRPWLAKPTASGAARVRESEREPISQTHQGQRLRPQQKSECTVAI
jgi:transposase